MAMKTRTTATMMNAAPIANSPTSPSIEVPRLYCSLSHKRGGGRVENVAGIGLCAAHFCFSPKVVIAEPPKCEVGIPSYDHRTRPACRKRNPRHPAHHHRVAPAELATRLLVDCQLAGTERCAAHRHRRKG